MRPCRLPLVSAVIAAALLAAACTEGKAGPPPQARLRRSRRKRGEAEHGQAWKFTTRRMLRSSVGTGRPVGSESRVNRKEDCPVPATKRKRCPGGHPPPPGARCMDLTRRRFLAAAPVAFGGPLRRRPCSRPWRRDTAPLPDLSDWDAVRAQFALDPALRALRQLLHRQPSGAGARRDRGLAARDRPQSVPRRRARHVRGRGAQPAAAGAGRDRALPRRPRRGRRAHPQHHRRARAGLPRPAAASRRRSADHRARPLLAPRVDPPGHERARARRCARSRCSTTRRPRPPTSIIERLLQAMRPADARGRPDLGAFEQRHPPADPRDRQGA